MPQSLGFVLVHLVFSTKGRAPTIPPEVKPALHAYLASVARNKGCDCSRVGGTSDHVHLAVRLSRSITLAQLVEELKTSSSKWLKEQAPGLATSSWQRGYGAFSVSPTQVDALNQYINDQEEHHRVTSFQEEYRSILASFGMEFDERYVWD